MKTLSRILSIGLLTLAAGCGGGSSNTTATSPATQCPSGQVYSTAVTPNQCLAQGACQAGFLSYNGSCVSAAATTACAAGQVSTQYGCLAQGSCPSGYAFYTATNSCTPAISTGTTTGGQNCPYLSSPQYGCLTQSPTCGVGYGLNTSGQCVQGTQSYPTYPGAPGYPGTPTYPGASCVGGYITQYGCLYQGNCYPNQVSYNGQCYNLIQPGYRGWNNSFGGGSRFQIHFGF